MKNYFNFVPKCNFEWVLTVINLIHIYFIFKDCFPGRLGGLHMLNQPWYVEAALTMCKPFLKDSTRKKVRQLSLQLFGFGLVRTVRQPRLNQRWPKLTETDRISKTFLDGVAKMHPRQMRWSRRQTKDINELEEKLTFPSKCLKHKMLQRFVP